MTSWNLLVRHCPFLSFWIKKEKGEKKEDHIGKTKGFPYNPFLYKGVATPLRPQGRSICVCVPRGHFLPPFIFLSTTILFQTCDFLTGAKNAYLWTRLCAGALAARRGTASGKKKRADVLQLACRSQGSTSAFILRNLAVGQPRGVRGALPSVGKRFLRKTPGVFLKQFLSFASVFFLGRPRKKMREDKLSALRQSIPALCAAIRGVKL